MKTMTAIGAALIGAAFTAAPAIAAQYGSQSSMQQTVTPRPAQEQPQQASTAADPTKLKTHIPKVSAQSVKQIQALQTAVDANNSAAIPAALAAAQAAAKTADDRYFIGLLQLKAAAAAKDQTGIASALEALLASGSAAQDEQFSLYFNLAQTYATLKQYDRAATNFQKALDASPNDVDAIAGLAEARVSQGQPAAALPLLQQGIQVQQAAGQKAPEAWYKRAVAIAYQAKLPQAVELGQAWVHAYPSADSWHNAIAIYRNLASPTNEATLDLLRLERAVGALQSAGEYGLYAATAADQLNFTEAQSIIDQGLSKSAISPSDPDLKEIIAALKTKPKATEAGLAEATTLAKEPLPLVRIGDRYAAMSEYEKAEGAYRAALTKPGADASLVNLHLGMALAGKGDKAAATAAFNAVSGPLSGVAKFWLVYLSTKG